MTLRRLPLVLLLRGGQGEPGGFIEGVFDLEML